MPIFRLFRLFAKKSADCRLPICRKSRPIKSAPILKEQSLHMIGAMDILDQNVYHKEYTELMIKIDENWSTKIEFIDYDKNRQFFSN